MVTPQLLSHNAGPASSSYSEIMGQLELAVVVSLGSNKFLHDLEQRPGSIFGHDSVRGVEYLVSQRTQGTDALVLFADLKGLQQMDDAICNAQPSGFSQFLYAMRMEMGVKLAFIIFLKFMPVQHVIDDGQQTMIPSVKHDAGQFAHDQFPFLKKGIMKYNVDRSPFTVNICYLNTSQTVLGKSKCAFPNQADLNQGIGIINGGIGIGNNAMSSDISIHKTFPSIIC
jgi:hypothetical protein